MSLSHPLPRELTRPVHVGGVQIGGGAPVVVQSMTCTDTADAQATLAQVCALAQAGCDIVRVSVPTEAALEGFRTICAESPVPIVADIHFNHKLAIGAVEAGAAKLRINPGNIGDWAKVDAVIDAAGAAGCAIPVSYTHLPSRSTLSRSPRSSATPLPSLPLTVWSVASK